MSQVTDTGIEISGHCDPSFERVREAFANNFARLGERGGAVALCLDGRPVVDLWGGWADVARTRPWTRETIVNVFSVSKALCAIAALRLVDRYALDLDQPVARYWPEFSGQSKHSVSVRQLLCHQAGLPALRTPLPDGAMLDWQRMTHALQDETPWWKPGDAHGYHVNTFGFLVGEIVRRISGETIGSLIRTQVAEPLGADIHIGLPAQHHERAAEFLWPGNPQRPAVTSDSDLMRWNTYWNPPGLSGGGWVNTAAWRSAELPSTNGHATARAIARVYSALANGGEVDGIRIVSTECLAEATKEHSNGHDLITQRPSRFGLAFQLTQPERPLGPNSRAFGHFGAGGSLGFCDPDCGLAFGYVMNEMGPRWQNPRNRALIDAAYACL